MVKPKVILSIFWSRPLPLWLFLALSMALVDNSAGEEGTWITGRVVGVQDGDSLTLLVEGNRQLKVRLESIDAPELGQEYGKNAKAFLSDLAFGKTAQVYATGQDKYGRTLGWVFVAKLNTNLELVRRGFAWNYVEYSKNREVAQAETQAREQRAGLWRDWRPMAPWDWRALQKRNAAEKKLAARTVTPSSNTPSATQNEEPATLHWLNTSSNKRHNRTCRYFGNTKRGKYCEASEGSACGICGG